MTKGISLYCSLEATSHVPQMWEVTTKQLLQKLLSHFCIYLCICTSAPVKDVPPPHSVEACGDLNQPPDSNSMDEERTTL